MTHPIPEPTRHLRDLSPAARAALFEATSELIRERMPGTGHVLVVIEEHGLYVHADIPSEYAVRVLEAAREQVAERLGLEGGEDG